MEDLLRVGVISSAHGIKGEVNVFPTTDEPEMFAHWKTLRLVEKKQSRLIHVRGAKYFKSGGAFASGIALFNKFSGNSMW